MDNVIVLFFLLQILECDQDDDLLTLVQKEGGGATHWVDSYGWPPASKKMTVSVFGLFINLAYELHGGVLVI